MIDINIILIVSPYSILITWLLSLTTQSQTLKLKNTSTVHFIHNTQKFKYTDEQFLTITADMNTAQHVLTSTTCAKCTTCATRINWH